MGWWVECSVLLALVGLVAQDLQAVVQGRLLVDHDGVEHGVAQPVPLHVVDVAVLVVGQRLVELVLVADPDPDVQRDHLLHSSPSSYRLTSSSSAGSSPSRAIFSDTLSRSCSSSSCPSGNAPSCSITSTKID